MSSPLDLGSDLDRPDHPVFAACSTLDGRLPKKIPFRSARVITVGSLKDRISQTFSLSSSSFHIAYHDDEEGEDCLVQTEGELTDAIWYFMSGTDSDDHESTGAVDRLSLGHLGTPSSNPTSTSISVPPRGKGWITLRFRIVLEYDGPSLSDTSSLTGSLTDLDLNRDPDDGDSAYTYGSSTSGFRASQTGSGSHTSGWGYRRRRVRDEVIKEESEQGSVAGPSNANSVQTQSDDGRLDDPPNVRIQRQPYIQCRPAPQDPLFPSNPRRALPRRPSALSSSESSISLTSSELGARWIEEQKARVARKIHGSASVSGSSVGSSRSKSLAGEEERSDVDGGTDYERGEGVLVLKVDGRGRCYYTYTSADMRSAFPYQTRASSTPPGLMVHPNPSTSTITTGYTDLSVTTTTEQPFEEAVSPPEVAPDCSACGTRLEYMRYVCTICGPAQVHGYERECEHEVETVLGYPRNHDRLTSSSDGESTTSTRRDASVRHPLEHLEDGSRSGDRRRSLEEVVSPLVPPVRSINPFTSGLSEPEEDETPESLPTGRTRNETLDGFELCSGCIESEGSIHTRLMGVQASRSGSSDGSIGTGGKLRRFGMMDHTYEEMIWSATGWRDIKYLDDAKCSICNAATEQNRFKCVTCPRFDLCRSCHQNVQEIHPTHAFLAVPDRIPKTRPPASIFSVETIDRNLSSIEHSEAFCHNCLGHIRGSRFHCTTCPAWDLCRDCQGRELELSTLAPHQPSHLMLEIPLPLQAHNLSRISARARDTWSHQDSSLGVDGELPGPQDLGRASSPDNDTVYGGAVPPPRVPTQRGTSRRRKDTLEHGLTCQGCNIRIRGQRFQCINCPSDPVAYNLCADCEARSHLLHDPMHVFVQLKRRVHYPLRSQAPLLPILYRRPVGRFRGIQEDSHPAAYLEHVVHHSTLCDIHVGPIQGVWLRCAHCANSFDICRACETVAEHDPTHIFIVLKSEVDMLLFRNIAALSGPHSRPLLQQRVFTM